MQNDGACMTVVALHNKVTHHLLRILTGMLLSLMLERKWTLIFIIFYTRTVFISQF